MTGIILKQPASKNKSPPFRHPNRKTGKEDFYMLIYPIYPDYQNQNGLTYDPSARFDLNHMNGYHENDCGYSLNDMNGLTYVDAVHFSYPQHMQRAES